MVLILLAYLFILPLPAFPDFAPPVPAFSVKLVCLKEIVYLVNAEAPVIYALQFIVGVFVCHSAIRADKRPTELAASVYEIILRHPIVWFYVIP